MWNWIKVLTATLFPVKSTDTFSSIVHHCVFDRIRNNNKFDHVNVCIACIRVFIANHVLFEGYLLLSDIVQSALLI